MESVRARSWADLQDLLYTDSWMPAIGRYRSQNAFRGLSDARYPLQTTLMRLGGRYPRLEPHLLRNFRKYAHRNVLERDSVWNWLSVGQHHGLPTRLLDWTFSPLIAMHFATANIDKFHLDGVIWTVNYAKAHRLLPERLKARMREEGSTLFTVEMLSAAAARLKDFDALSETTFAVFFEPPSLDDRIVNQSALFSVLSSPAVDLETWLEAHPDLVRKIILPSELKWEVRDKLDQANVNEKLLFPGLDGLSRLLKRQYSPRDIAELSESGRD